MTEPFHVPQRLQGGVSAGRLHSSLREAAPTEKGEGIPPGHSPADTLTGLGEEGLLRGAEAWAWAEQ